MQSSNKTYVEILFLVLIVAGLFFEFGGLGVDYAHFLGGPNFNLALDLELAGLALILFGFVGDVLYSHVRT